MAIPQVVVLGGGYVAVYVCRALRRAVERRQVQLTVVSSENFHIWHGFIGEMLVGLVSPSHILSPGRRIFAPARLQVAHIEGVDLDRRVVHVCRQPDGRPLEIPYDHLIIGLGTRQNTSAYPGLAEHAYKLKTWDDCFELRNHLLQMLELASLCTDPDERRAMLTFFIAGGGFSGAEVAGSMADMLRRLIQRDYRELDPAEVRIVLVHSGPTILPELHGERVETRQFKQFPRLVRYATRHLKRLGVEVRTGTRVAAVSRNLVVLEGGERIPSRTIISAVGTRPQALVEGLDLPKDRLGRLETDATCRVQGHENLWAAGDCAAVPHPRGGFCPPTALWAMMAGARIGGNVELALQGRPLRPFRFPGLGQAVSLGGGTAVGELFGVPVTGRLAWLLWRAVLFYFFPSRGQKSRILCDWLLHPFVGYDGVEMSVRDRDDFQIEYCHFEADEIVVKQGQVGRSLFLVAEGEVEVVRDLDFDGIPDVLSLVGPGGYIGHDVQDGVARHTARTRTPVRAVEIRIEEASRLAEVLRLLGSARLTAQEDRV